MNLNAREAQLDLFSQSALNISGKMDTTRATMSFDSVIRGYHIYKDLPWVPVIGETFSCEREPFNIHDPYAVAIKLLFYEEKASSHVKLLELENTHRTFHKVALKYHADLFSNLVASKFLNYESCYLKLLHQVANYS